MSTSASLARPPARWAVIDGRRFAWIRALLFAAALLPLARLVVLGWTARLGANPAEFVQRSLGTWALVMLCATLAITPLRRLTGWTWLVRLRRMAGLFCFFYVVLHLATYVVLDQWFDWAAIWKDVVKRPFITAGFAAFVALVPLAATSTDAMQRRLGGRRWRRLHRIVYPIAAAAILHFWWHKAGKHDYAEPAIYGAVVALLLLARLADWRRRGALRSA